MPILETLMLVIGAAAEMLGDVDFDSPVDADINGHGNPGDTNVHGNGPQNVHGNDPGNMVHGGRPTDVWGRPSGG